MKLTIIADSASDGAARHRRTAMVLLGVVALLPLVATLTFGFVYDDVALIQNAPSRHSLNALWNAWGETYWPESAASGLYRPVTQALWGLLWYAAGGRPWAFHAWALFLHIAATIGCFHLLRRAVPTLAAYLGALLFAVHPVHVEAVANVTNSSEVFVALLAIAMLALGGRVVEATPPDSAVPWRAGVAAALLYALALGSKESGAVLPALLFIWLWGWRDSAREQSPPPTLRHVLRCGRTIWISCALALVVMMLARWQVLGALAVQQEYIAPGIRGLGATVRVWTMIGAWPTAVSLLTWPAHLSMHYGPDSVPTRLAFEARHALVLGGAALLLLVTGALARRGDRRPLVALLWIAISYLPASNLLVPTGQLLAERTLYLPSIGVIMLAGWAIDRGAHALERIGPTPYTRMAVILPALLLATIGATRSYTAARVWRSDEALFRSGIASAPNASHPHYLLGDWYAKRGDQEHALALFARAHQLDPANSRVLFVYTKQLRASGQHDSALSVLRDAVRREPNSWPRRLLYLTNLGEIRGPDALIAEARLIPTSDTAGLYRQTRLLASAYEAKGMPDSVLHILERGAVALPRYGLLQFFYAQSLHEHGDDAGTERQLKLAERDRSVRRYDIALLRAKMALSRGDTSAAAQAILSAHEAAPRDTALARLARQVRTPSVPLTPATAPRAVSGSSSEVGGRVFDP